MLQCAMEAKKYDRTAFSYDDGMCTIGNILGAAAPNNDWLGKSIFAGEYLLLFIISPPKGAI